MLPETWGFKLPAVPAVPVPLPRHRSPTGGFIHFPVRRRFQPTFESDRTAASISIQRWRSKLSQIIKKIAVIPLLVAPSQLGKRGRLKPRWRLDLIPDTAFWTRVGRPPRHVLGEKITKLWSRPEEVSRWRERIDPAADESNPGSSQRSRGSAGRASTPAAHYRSIPPKSRRIRAGLAPKRFRTSCPRHGGSTGGRRESEKRGIAAVRFRIAANFRFRGIK